VHRPLLQQLRFLLHHGRKSVPSFHPSPHPYLQELLLTRRETDVKFLLLHAPSQPAATNTTRASTSIAANPTSPQTEEAIKQFFTEIYENWVKTIMNPFYQVNMEVKSPVFRARVAAAGKKYL
jgi:hypothetical protein